MKLKGMAKVKSLISEMQETIGKKIDDVDPSTTKGEKLEDKLDSVWMSLDDILEAIKEINEI